MEEIIKEYKNLLNNYDEHLSFETLAVYNNPESKLSENEKQFVELHLKKCSQCRLNLETVIKEDDEFDEMDNERPKIFRMPNYFKYVAAASILIIISVIFFLNNSQSINDDKLVILSDEPSEDLKSNTIMDSIEYSKETEEIIDKKIDLEINNENAELYAENTILENFIERTLRSEKNMKITVPQNGETVKIPIKIELNRNNYLEPVELIIVNNNNEKLLTVEIINGSYLLEENLKQGLFYWKLKVNDRVEDFGKFIIK